MKQNVLKKKIIKIFKNHKLSNSHALICANALINAELVGAPTHGLSRLKMYCDRINKKVVNPKPKIKIKKISQSITHIDADNSIGFVAADIGIKKAISNAKKTGIGLVAIKNISKSISYIDANNSIGFVAADIGIKKAITNAKKTGIGLVGIKNSGHYGLSGYYAEQAVKKNLITMCFTNAPPAIAPYGSIKSLFDIVWIDADHSYDSVSRDIDLYHNKVKPGGIVCGHDYDWPEVHRAVHERYKDVESHADDVWLVRTK